MMERTWSDILRRFGQEAMLHTREGDFSVRALVQPCLDRGGQQEAAGPLGLGRQDRFRYMGPPDRPLDLDAVVECQGRAYRVLSAHLVGEGLCPHWWAMLCPRDEVGI